MIFEPDVQVAQSSLKGAPDPSTGCRQLRVVSDAEKLCYVSGHHCPLVLFGLVSSLLLLIGLSRFAFIEAILLIAVPFLLINGVYLLLSYGVMLLPGTFRWNAHQELIRRWGERASQRGISVDVYLPVCGESHAVIRETWDGVQQLRWAGLLKIWVLDDSPDDSLRALAAEYGFHYLHRSGRELRKAGNLRSAFQQTAGEFILLLDADFRPRAEMLEELVPYLLADERVAIVQSPQFFNVQAGMNWVQSGAGYVQELFYRLIQPARDRVGAAVCVGSCAVYRRAALVELGGMAAIDHSEDLWTGFELMNRGWRIRYLPVVLAKGLCPDRLGAFFNQQYRWCHGSLTLVLSSRFWMSQLNWRQKFCFAAGFAYYFATAWNVLLAPFPLLVMVCLFPEWLHWNHLVFSILALIYTPFVLNWWSVFPFGFHFLTTREVSGAAHLQCLCNTLTGRSRDWVVTGSRTREATGRPAAAILCLLGVSMIGAAGVWLGAAIAVHAHPERWIHLIPPVFFASMQFVICWRALDGLPVHPRRSLWRWVARNAAGRQEIDWQRLVIGSGLTFACLLLMAVTLLPHRTKLAGQDSGEQRKSAAEWSARVPLNTDPNADFGEYIVENAFPGIEPRGIVRMREHPKQDNLFFLAEFTGVLQMVRARNGEWEMQILADLRQGDLAFLYSFAIHPNFPEDPHFFLSYKMREQNGEMAFRVTSLSIPTHGVATHRDEQLLIEQSIETDEHLGGDLAFDQTGCLLISCGDNERSLHDRRSQIINEGFASGILRIDVDQRGPEFSHPPVRRPENAWTANYRIPSDNPFVGLPNVLEEYWALGLRNPFRMAFAPDRRQLWIGDVGQDRLEQLEIAFAGSNHQWSFQEGSLPFEQSYLHGQPPAAIHGVSTSPSLEYPHDDLNSCIIGGDFVRKGRFPELNGHYLFGDNRSGRIWTTHSNPPSEKRLLLQLPFGKSSSSLVSITADRSGEIYFTSFVSVPPIYRLKLSEPMHFPQRLSKTNLFQNTAELLPADEVIPYEVAVPLWSDGLRKRRWIRLPAGSTVKNEQGRWRFPTGTVLIKHFEQGPDFDSPGAPVETRLLVVREDGSTAGASYRWNDDHQDATLQLDRVDIPLVSGGSSFAYHLPGFRDCKVCHHRDNPVLGFNEEQLNVQATDATGKEQQLVQLSHRGLFQNRYDSQRVAQARRLTQLHDLSASLENRSRSYLHANCSFCHHIDGLEHVSLNLNRFDSFRDSELVHGVAKLGYHQIDGHYARRLIAPGELHDSAIYLRMKTDQPQFAMPYLGRTRPDLEALGVISDWILSLKSGDVFAFDDVLKTSAVQAGEQQSGQE